MRRRAIHAGGTAGGHRDHRHPGRLAAAGGAGDAGIGAADFVRQQSEADRAGDAQLPRRPGDAAAAEGVRGGGSSLSRSSTTPTASAATRLFCCCRIWKKAPCYAAYDLERTTTDAINLADHLRGVSRVHLSLDGVAARDMPERICGERLGPGSYLISSRVKYGDYAKLDGPFDVPPPRRGDRYQCWSFAESPTGHRTRC